MNMNRKPGLIAALALALPWIGAHAAGNIIAEDFTGASTTNSWTALGGACLTAGDSSSASNGGIPACVGDPFYYAWPSGISTATAAAAAGYNPSNSHAQLPLIGLGSGTGTADTAGNGALRLTNGGSQGYNEAGAIFSNWTFPSNQGLQVTFTTYTYGGNAYGNSSGVDSGADGIGFYLTDGSRSAAIGAFGGSLGYSCAQGKDPADGMAGGYLGLGIDEYGNFSNSGDNTATGPGTAPGYIVMRGHGDVNWAWLNANYPTYYPSSLSTSKRLAAVQATCQSGKIWNYSSSNNPSKTNTAAPDYAYINHWPVSGQIFSQENNANATRTNATAITYQLIINANGQLTLAYQPGVTAAFTDLISSSDKVFITTSNGALPATFRFGFGASTGGGTNVHEITCFEASPAARTTGAPFVPISISSSGSYAYTLNTNPSPTQGLVQAYSVQPDGSTASTASWEAGALMSTYRTTPVSTSASLTTASRLYSTASNGTSVTPLISLDSAAFGSISNTTCLGSTSTMQSGTNLNQAEYNIVNYTVNPSYVWSGMTSSCSTYATQYLGTRQSGSYLSTFASDDDGLVLGPPNTPANFALSGYSNWAAGLKSRPSALLFTNDDGFLYSVDASSGTLNWGWMPRAFVSGLQNYSTFPNSDNFAGKFTAVDAYDGSAWATYVVGSAKQGALWYDLKLSSSGSSVPQPSTVVPTTLPSSLASATYPSANYSQSGVTPSIQEGPVTKTVGSNQYAAFIVNTGSGSSTASYLVEFKVASGIPSSATVGSAYVAQIPAASIGGSGNYASSNLYLDSANGTLEFGTTGGRLYQMPFTGSAATDVGLIGALGTAHDTTDPVLYVGAQQVAGYPYAWAASMNEIDVFGIGAKGWQALWASTNAHGYTYTAGTGTGAGWNTSSAVTTLTGSSVISDMPTVINGVLVVPVYVPPSAGAAACNINGNGFQDYFSLTSGKFPTGAITDSNGHAVNADTALGLGQSYTLNVATSSNGLLGFSGTSSSGTPSSALVFKKGSLNQPVQWRVH